MTRLAALAPACLSLVSPLPGPLSSFFLFSAKLGFLGVASLVCLSEDSPRARAPLPHPPLLDSPHGRYPREIVLQFSRLLAVHLPSTWTLLLPDLLGAVSIR